MAHQEPRRGKRVRETEDFAKQEPGKLSRSWNKSARVLKKGLMTGILALSLSAGFTAAAQAETRDNRPPVAAMSKAEKQQKKDYAFSQERLDKIEARMKQTELGRALLQFAEDQNIAISMSNSKVIDSDPKDRLFTKGRNYSTYIRLNGEMKSDDEIMMTLAHELRHSWHERVVKSGEMDLDPRRHWLMRRIQEADAFSFEVHFGYEYEKATGKRLDIGDRYNACNGNTPFICLAEEYRRARDGGKPAPEAYSQLLERGMRHVRAMKYDKTFGGELDDGWGRVIATPSLGSSFAGRFDHPVTDADFVAKMRAVATEGLVPGVDPGALTKWTDADFLSFDKTGGKDKGDMKKLTAAEKKFAAAKAAWDKYEASRTSPPSPPGA
ncbi:MAG: hypothetical protein EPN97_05535 [Alphaproteobacteria bacterium]|nr:MAG: hypothetical protein EPN97_05535 [Alphaproteobacteria bacterium]